jgi:GntR family transcriptional regulator
MSTGVQASVATPLFRSEPLWQRAVAELRAWVTGADVGPGARLPTERVLCERFGVSRMTLRKALLALVDEEVLARENGRGWFRAPTEAPREWPNRLESFTETASRMGLRSSSLVLRDELSAASLDEAERFAIAPGTVVHRLDRVRMLDDVPIAIDRSVLRGDAAAIALADGSGSLFESLRRSGLELEQSDATIEALGCAAVDAEHLGVPVGAPVLMLDQLVRDADGRPVMTSTVVYAGDRYRLRTSFARPGRRSG